jgi:hypothetical protein
VLHPLGIAVVGCLLLLTAITAALLWEKPWDKDLDDPDDPF